MCNLERNIIGMPEIRCSRCGESIYIDPMGTPYTGDLACIHCKNVMEVSVSQSGSKVTTKYPNPFEDLAEWWPLLTVAERTCLVEAAIALGDNAYTASEFMSLRNLESLCRRAYKKVKGEEYTGGWFEILDILADDKDFEPYADVLHYFRRVRNRIAHPDRLSTKLAAESSYKMSLRLTRELLAVLSKK